MAVRGRNGGGVGLIVALILLVVLSVILTIVSIVFYLQWSKTDQLALAAVTDKARYVREAEENQGPIKALAANPQASVVGQLMKENQQLKNVIIGDPTASYQTIADAIQANDALRENPAILTVYQGSAATVTDLQNQLAQAQRDKTELSQQIEQLQKSNDQVAAQFRDNLKQLESRLTIKQGELDAYSGSVKGEFDKLNTRMGEIQSQSAEAEKALQAELQKKKEEITLLEARLAEIPVASSKAPELDPSLQPDGDIVSVGRDQDLAFINRGRADRLVLGMTFEVFEHDTLPGRDAFGELRGKASVEVVNMQENASTVRIVRRTNRAIVAGDIIANVVYDPNLTLRFFFFGDFDIDTLGSAQTADRRRLENMVSDWGGKVMEKLSYQTDFLVLGAEPRLPEPLSSGTTDAATIERHEQARLRFEAYQSLVGEARALKIPILNQNRFLYLVGYYQRVPMAPQLTPQDRMKPMLPGSR